MTAYHLMVEGVVGRVHSAPELYRFIRRVTSREFGIDMTIIAGPMCIQARDHRITYAIIAESHVLVNEFDTGVFTLDVFSCVEFPPSVPIDMAREWLDLQDGYVMRLLPRAGV